MAMTSRWACACAGGLPRVLGLAPLGLLLRFDRGLIRLRLRDLRLPLDLRVVRGGHRGDVAGLHVVDGADLQRVDGEPDLGHLGLGAVEHLGGQLLPLGDDLLHGHRTDDGPQVTGEDATGEHAHLVLVGQKPLRRVDNALLVVADLERDHGAHVQRDPLPAHADFRDLSLGE
jgi:hypothetical protein